MENIRVKLYFVSRLISKVMKREFGNMNCENKGYTKLNKNKTLPSSMLF